MVTQSPTGYSVVLPPGWVRIPVNGATEESVAHLLDLRFGSTARNAREVAYAQLGHVVAAARHHGGLDLFVPWQGVHELGGGSTFVVSTLLSGADSQPDPVDWVDPPQGSRSRRVSIDGVCGLRRERDLPAGSAELGPHVRLVDYFLPVPNRSGRWIVATSATIVARDSSGNTPNQLVELFDSIMCTFRWEGLSNVS